MERVIQVINRMQADGVISKYAIGGGIAAIYYLEPYETDDIDVFISVAAVAVGQAGLILLEPIYGYLKNLGYQPVREGVLIEDWLVQFIPTFEQLQIHIAALSKDSAKNIGLVRPYIMALLEGAETFSSVWIQGGPDNPA